MVHQKNIDEYKLNFKNNITYDRHMTYIKLFITFSPNEVSHMSNLCQKYALYKDSKYFDIILNLTVEMTKKFHFQLKATDLYTYIKILNPTINSNTLIITNHVTTLKYFDKYIDKCDMLTYINYEYSDNFINNGL